MSCSCEYIFIFLFVFRNLWITARHSNWNYSWNYSSFHPIGCNVNARNWKTLRTIVARQVEGFVTSGHYPFPKQRVNTVSARRNSIRLFGQWNPLFRGNENPSKFDGPSQTPVPYAKHNGRYKNPARARSRERGNLFILWNVTFSSHQETYDTVTSP